MQNHPFRLNPQMLPILGLLFLMLALPVGLMVWGFAPRPQRQTGPQEASEAAREAAGNPLRESLEQAANAALRPPSLDGEAAEVVLRVADVGRAAKNLAALAAEAGGSALVDERSTSEIRVLASVPPANLPEFTRRAGLATGLTIEIPEGSALVGITLLPAGKP